MLGKQAQADQVRTLCRPHKHSQESVQHTAGNLPQLVLPRGIQRETTLICPCYPTPGLVTGDHRHRFIDILEHRTSLNIAAWCRSSGDPVHPDSPAGLQASSFPAMQCVRAEGVLRLLGVSSRYTIGAFYHLFTWRVRVPCWGERPPPSNAAEAAPRAGITSSIFAHRQHNELVGFAQTAQPQRNSTPPGVSRLSALRLALCATYGVKTCVMTVFFLR